MRNPLPPWWPCLLLQGHSTTKVSQQACTGWPEDAPVTRVLFFPTMYLKNTALIGLKKYSLFLCSMLITVGMFFLVFIFVCCRCFYFDTIACSIGSELFEVWPCEKVRNWWLFLFPASSWFVISLHYEKHVLWHKFIHYLMSFINEY